MKRVVAVLPSLAGGGAERVVVNLLMALDRNRFDPHLLLLDRSGPLQSALPADLSVIDLGQPRLTRAMPKLLQTLRRLHPDVTFSSLGYVNMGLLGLRRMLPGRVMIREANLPSLSVPRSPHPSLMALGYRHLYRRADRVLASSSRMAGELSGFGIAPDRIHVLHNPVAVAALRQQAATPRRLPGEGLRLVAVGRLTEQKGFDRLIPLLAGIPGLRLLLLGEGPQRGHLADLARKHGVIVEMPGFVHDAPAWFAGADAFLLPSRWEGMPNAALEALACGIPVIATPEAGGIAEIVTIATGGAVTIASPGEEFFRAILRVSPRGDDALRPSLLPAAYDMEAVGRQFSRHLDDMS